MFPFTRVPVWVTHSHMYIKKDVKDVNLWRERENRPPMFGRCEGVLLGERSPHFGLLPFPRFGRSVQERMAKTLAKSQAWGSCGSLVRSVRWFVGFMRGLPKRSIGEERRVGRGPKPC